MLFSQSPDRIIQLCISSLWYKPYSYRYKEPRTVHVIVFTYEQTRQMLNAVAICVSIPANLGNMEGLPLEDICYYIIAHNHLFTQLAV